MTQGIPAAKFFFMIEEESRKKHESREPSAELMSPGDEDLMFEMEDLNLANSKIHRLDQLENHLLDWLEKNIGPEMKAPGFDPSNNPWCHAADVIRDAWNSQATTLDLRNAGIDNLPRVVGQMTELETLDLSFNTFKALPLEIMKLAQLRTLNVSGNPMSEANWEILGTICLEHLIADSLPHERFPDRLVALAEKGVKVSFAYHQLDRKALRSACERLKKNHASHRVSFVSTTIHALDARFADYRFSALSNAQKSESQAEPAKRIPWTAPQPIPHIPQPRRAID